MLIGFWHLALGSEQLRPGRTRPVTIAGEAMLLGRDASGTAFAVPDRCPHRNMPLRHGTFDGTQIRCGYHGWAFAAADGRCTEIPGLAEADPAQVQKFRLHKLPCREIQGNVWVLPGGADPQTAPPIPTIPGLDGQVPRTRATLRFPCDADTAVFGFIDPAHPPFVHTSRWWKKPGASLRLKEKAFVPEGLGFRMASHRSTNGANPYRLLGRDVRITVDIALPGTRVEHIVGSRHTAGVLAVATPVEEHVTDVHYCAYWTMPYLGFARPLANYMTRDFLTQDRNVAVQLAEAGATGTPKLFVGDADAQIRWWLRLRREWAESRTEDRPFNNPLRPQTLRWRS